MKKERITRTRFIDGKWFTVMPDGTLRPRHAKGQTDWARVAAMTDEDIARAVAEDPDAAPLWDPAKEHRVTTLDIRIDVAALRERLGMSQQRFAWQYGFNARALQEWEQGRRKPNRTALILLAVIAHEPEAVQRALMAERREVVIPAQKPRRKPAKRAPSSRSSSNRSAPAAPRAIAAKGR